MGVTCSLLTWNTRNETQGSEYTKGPKCFHIETFHFYQGEDGTENSNNDNGEVKEIPRIP